MGRVIGSVVLGYIVMFVTVFVLFTITWMAVGMDGAFQEGNFNPSGTWIAATFVVGIVAGLAGGLVAAAVGHSDPRAMWGLIGLIVVLGVLFAFPAMQLADTPMEARTPDLTMMDAMAKARTPVWLALLNPVLGAVGVYLGFRMKKPAPAPVAAV